MGGRGASFNSPQRIASAHGAKNHAQLADYMKDVYGIRLTENTESINFEALREYTEGVEDVLRDFPEIKGNILFKWITVDDDRRLKKNVLAGVDVGGMYLNRDVFSNVNDAREEMKVAIETGWSYGAPDYRTIGHHETGHVVERILGEKWQMAEMDKLPAFSKMPKKVSRYKEASDQLKKISRQKNKELKDKGGFSLPDHSSGYGRTSDGEAFAEAFADYYGSKGKTKNVLTQEIMKETKKRWKERMK